MAAYCTKCMSEIPAGVQFCARCGTQVMAPGPAAAPPQATGIPPQPATAPPKSGGALKIVLVIVAVFAGLGILALCAVGYVGWRVTRAVHVNSSTGEVTLHTPQGTISANSNEKLTAEDLGVAIYPGAIPADSGGGRMTVATGSMTTGVFVTPDPQDKVVEFYKNKANGEALETAQGALVTIKNGENDSVAITISPNTSKTEGKTQIAILHTINNKSS